jgi:hypothetical protein
MMKKSIVIHPFLLAAYPTLFLYSHNIGEVTFNQTLVPIAVTVGIASAAWLILGLVFKNMPKIIPLEAVWKKSAIIVSLFLALFFSYGYFRIPLGNGNLFRLMSLTWIAIFIFGSFFTIISKKNFAIATMVLNIVTGILVILPVSNIIHRFSDIRKVSHYIDSMAIQNFQPVEQNNSYPDIYFIILDAYAREDILRQMYNFDNSNFLNFLRDKGFYIADRSFSNYCQTGLSVGSCFNLSYLDGLVRQVGHNYTDRLILNTYIKKSYALSFLKKHGYKIVAFPSNALETKLQDIADTYLDSGTSINMFHVAIKNMTPLPDIIAEKKTSNDFDKHRAGILYTLDNLGKVASTFQSPKFIFAHLEIPHPPFVFGPYGQARNLEVWFNDQDGDWLICPGRLNRGQYRRYYIDQLIFLNNRMKKVVDEILRNSSQPPIIMILGDHGPRSETIWEDPNKTNVRECLAILNAYYLPNNGDKLLYPEITPVNSFRVIFNHYFGQKNSLLPDKTYFSTAMYLYKFYDVTEKLRNQ